MSQKLLLKVLNGLQSGAEVALDSGEYRIGSGPEDDLQLRDVSLKSGHARLRIGSDGPEIKAGAGDILLSNGGKLEAGDDRWVRLEPLAVFVLGTTRISIGPPEANWASITDDEEFRRSARAGVRGGSPASMEPAGVESPAEESSALEKRLVAMGFPAGASVLRSAGAVWNRHPRIAAGASSALVALLFSFLLIGPYSDGAGETVRRDHEADRIAIERAVASLPFANKVRVKQEVDGQIIVRGIIRDSAERRAVIGALEATRAPFRPRLATSEAIMTETRNLLGPLASRVRFVLREDGVLALSGLIIDPALAAKTVEIVRNQVSGPTEIDTTRLKTGADIVAEVTRMAREEGIGTNVLFALSRADFIEATGAVPASQINAWVSVLLNYGDMFADKLPLRSLVQLVATGDAARPADALDRPIIVGQAGEADGRVVDLQRLKSGRFAASEIFAQERGAGASPSPLAFDPNRAADRRASSPAQGQAATGGMPLVAQRRPPSEASRPGESVRDPVKLIERWAAGETAASEEEKRLFRRLEETMSRTAPADHKALRAHLLARGSDARPLDACREARPGDAPILYKALLWLDLLSTVEGLSLRTLDRETQLQAAEVMLSPMRVKDCLARLQNREAAARMAASTYLGEAVANPDFAAYVARDALTSRLRLSGARTEVENGYVVDAQGRFLRNGASIDLFTRIWSIGETGVVVEKADGAEILLYDRGLAWISRPSYPGTGRE